MWTAGLQEDAGSQGYQLVCCYFSSAVPRAPGFSFDRKPLAVVQEEWNGLRGSFGIPIVKGTPPPQSVLDFSLFFFFLFSSPILLVGRISGD